MTDSDIHLLTGAYAADALPDDERRAFEEHLAGCPSCAQETAELVATTSRLAMAVAERAPARLRERVLDEIRHVRQDPPSTTATADAAPRTAWFRQPLAMAASFLLVVCLGLAAAAMVANQQADEAEQTASRVAYIATHPERVTLTHRIETGGRATVLAAAGDAVFRAEDLPVLPEDRGYQLWVMNESGARSVAVLGRGTSSHVEELVEDVGPGDSLGVTIEPREGSEEPTGTAVLLMSMSA